MKKSIFTEGSTALLLGLVAWYFGAYVLTGLAPKILTGGLFGFEKIPSAANLWYSTIGSSAICLLVVAVLKWPKRFKSEGTGMFGIAKEYYYLGPAGIATGIIIVTTPAMYMFKDVSVMVAMIAMRGCVIVVGRVVDEILIRSGASDKKVSRAENASVVIALCAIVVAGVRSDDKASIFSNGAAVITLALYVGSYFIRVFIMTWKKSRIDKLGYFAGEQAFTTVSLLVLGAVVLSMAPTGAIAEVHHAAFHPNGWAIFAGTFFGLAAFPSVFLFMFKGRTGTFSALANRLTSLLAGTVSTLILAGLGVGKWPVGQDWMAFGMVLIAVAILASSETNRPKISAAK